MKQTDIQFSFQLAFIILSQIITNIFLSGTQRNFMKFQSKNLKLCIFDWKIVNIKKKDKPLQSILLFFLIIVFFSTNVLTSYQNNQNQRNFEFQIFQAKFTQSYQDIQKIFQLRNRVKEIRNSRDPTNSDVLIKIYLQIAQLYEKLNLQEDSEHFINLAYQLDQWHPEVYYQKTKNLILKFNPHTKNSNQAQIENHLKILKESIQGNSFLKNISNEKFTQLNRLFEYKKIAFKSGYEYTFDWMKSIKLNQLKFQYISHDKIQKRWIKQKGGYGVFAKQQIPEHKVLIVEKPFFYLGQKDGINMMNEFQENKVAVLKKYKSLYKISKIFRQKYSLLSSKKSEHLPFDDRVSYFMLSDQQIYDKYVKNSFFINHLSDVMHKVKNPYYRTGLYEFGSLINHSCDPNLSYSFIGKYILIRTQKNIKKDEELTYAYIKTYNKSTNQRRQQIFTNWEFQCNCNLCNKNETIFEPTQEAQPNLQL